MAFDYKREYKEYYAPPRRPGIVDVPAMNFIAVRGSGDPNREDGEYQQAISLLYAVAFTIKMSKRAGHLMDGYFDYVVPPLEGFWWQEGVGDVDYAHKERFEWIAAIRLPDFVTEAEFAWAIQEATRKKRTDFSRVEFMPLQEGLCVQCLHVGPYDDEPATVTLMHEFAQSEGYVPDFSDVRRHHEIYLSDARRVAPERLRTVIRHPVRPA
ncbi:GyrI-like domain-containing protein [Actinomyces ruminis]|uniref:Transcriptional regulator n=1 Tax=Actinomyces ruminis TaxID=1937003 RepID=A0ABX4M9C2_9ACTO|nr:GyrI-like domain-containing protein [Actinomyces ruminis]PHP52060.1 transcriptional regulator [Actinomyces ruminis]